ncbi:MAG TPA: RsiV family protein [Afipia sp.]
MICFSAAGLAGPSALAAESKPDFTFKTKAADVSVMLDAGIKANPALAADCLAEGKRYAGKQRKEADAARRDDPKLFATGGYTYERRYTTASVIGRRYVSLVRQDYENTHGAHPNTYINTILWDDTGKKRISIRPFFKETADGGPTLTTMVKAVIAALKDEKKRRGAADDGTSGIDWYNGIEPSLLKIGPVTLAPSTEPDKSSGLIFHYEPYAVGPYAEGSFEAFVPWQVLQPYLSPEGAAIFSGSQPERHDNDK